VYTNAWRDRGFRMSSKLAMCDSGDVSLEFLILHTAGAFIVVTRHSYGSDVGSVAYTSHALGICLKI